MTPSPLMLKLESVPLAKPSCSVREAAEGAATCVITGAQGVIGRHRCAEGAVRRRARIQIHGEENLAGRIRRADLAAVEGHRSDGLIRADDAVRGGIAEHLLAVAGYQRSVGVHRKIP